MAVVYIMRHGETPYNVMEILTGRGSDPALTEKGRAQAMEAAKYLHEHYIDHIDIIVSSNMTRTNQTAEIINELLQKPMLFDVDIQEIDRGGFEGHAKDYALPIIRELADYESHPIHGGESLNEFKNRITSAVCKYFNMKAKAVLLVSHGFSAIIAGQEFTGKEEEDFHNARVLVLDPSQIEDLAGKCAIQSYDSDGL